MSLTCGLTGTSSFPSGLNIGVFQRTGNELIWKCFWNANDVFATTAEKCMQPRQAFVSLEIDVWFVISMSRLFLLHIQK